MWNFLVARSTPHLPGCRAWDCKMFHSRKLRLQCVSQQKMSIKSDEEQPDSPGCDTIASEYVWWWESVWRWNEAWQSPSFNQLVGALPDGIRHQAVVCGGKNPLLCTQVLALNCHHSRSSRDCQLGGLSPVCHGVVLLLKFSVEVDFHLVVASGKELPVYTTSVVGHPIADEDLRVEEKAVHASDLLTNSMVTVAKVWGAKTLDGMWTACTETYKVFLIVSHLREVSILLAEIGLARSVRQECLAGGPCKEEQESEEAHPGDWCDQSEWAQLLPAHNRCSTLIACCQQYTI